MIRTTSLLLALAVALAGCAQTTPPPADDPADDEEAPQEGATEETEDETPSFDLWTATIRPTTAEGVGEEVLGRAFAAPDEDGVLLYVLASGLAPGEHGTHVHANPSCEPAVVDGNATAAGASGAHWDPTNATHGAHAGDLGNLVVGDDGRGFLVVRKDFPYGSFDGRSLVVHRDADDLATDPSGNSGPRVACAVFELGDFGALVADLRLHDADLREVSTEGFVPSALDLFVGFAEAFGGLYMAVHGTGLPPGEHALHIHENASCAPADVDGVPTPAGAAGGHWNPTNATHGAHAGDLPNLVVGDDGSLAQGYVLDAEWSIADALGLAVVLHRDADDGVSQPAGASGPRIACGLLGVSG